MRQRILEIIRKEARQTFREPKMRILLFMPPLIQLIIFGYSVNLDVEDSRVAWMDGDQTNTSRDLRAEFDGSAYFRITHYPANEKQAQELLDRAEVSMIVSVLPGFARRIDRGDTGAVQVLIDGSDSNTASVAASYATQVVARYAADRLEERQKSLQMSAIASSDRDGPMYAAVPSIRVGTRVWFNEDLRSRNYFVPGVVVNIITLVTLMLTAMAIVREKEIGTMEQLMVTPIRPIELVLGKTLPFAVVGLVQMVLVIVAALLIFRIPLRGSIPLLFLGAVLYLMTTLGMGLFISTVSNTQQQALMGSFFFFTPAFMLSGFTFPVQNMPVPVQILSYANPVRYFMELVRGLFLKGVGVEALWPQMLGMAVFGGLILTFSVLRFHKRLD